MHVVARQLGKLLRQDASLHRTGKLDLAMQELAGDQGLGHARARQCYGTLRRQRLGHGLVFSIESAPFAVEQLHDPDQAIVVIHQRQRQAAARAKSRCAVDLSIEARVGVAVGHVDDGAVLRAAACQAGTQRHTQLTEVTGNLDEELACLLVKQPHRRSFGVHNVAGSRRNLAQHGAQVEGRGQCARHSENRLHVLRREGGGDHFLHV